MILKQNGMATNQEGQNLSEGTYFWTLDCVSNCKRSERIKKKRAIFK